LFPDQLLFPGGLPLDVGLTFHSLPANLNACPLAADAAKRSIIPKINDDVLIIFLFKL